MIVNIKILKQITNICLFLYNGIFIFHLVFPL
uniref:Uncharacterized protein n=1 Tax=Heterorhabditis bacteriophora TaxID=37862 RepID=A0A1I7WL41_HETBA